jgi:hypothetical protein
MHENNNHEMTNPNAMEELNIKMDRIEKLLEKNSMDCEKMSNHIDFVERIYEYIKKPLFFITNQFRYLSTQQKIPKNLEHEVLLKKEEHENQAT